jgi:hypothetical protein
MARKDISVQKPTYNGWPLYLFTGEKPYKNHADSSFKVVRVPMPSK